MCGLYFYTPSHYWLVVSTHLKNMSQIEVGIKIKTYLKPPPRLEWHCSFEREKTSLWKKGQSKWVDKATFQHHHSNKTPLSSSSTQHIESKLSYGCFLKWWYPQNTPTWSFLVGKPMVVGYHHFRKPPYILLLIVIIGIIIVILILIHQELIIIKHMVVSLITHLICCVRLPPNNNKDRQDYYMLHHRIPINLHLPDPTGPLNIPQALKYLLMKGILSSLLSWGSWVRLKFS